MWDRRLSHVVRERLKSRGFWGVQMAIAAITLFHYVTEFPDPKAPWDHVHHLGPALYVFPIIYASERWGREGGMFTGLWCALLTAPNTVLWHTNSFEWIVELGQIAIAVTVALVLSSLVEQEGHQRQRAERLLERVSLVNREILRAQEEERLRISRELHDDTVQGLALVSRRLDDAMEMNQLPERVETQLRETREHVRGITTNVRAISRHLRPPPLEDLGLVAAIESHIRDLGSLKHTSGEPAPELHLNVQGRPRRIDGEAEVGLFRIVQEALSNVVRHSSATEASVTVKFEDDRIAVEVRDDGNGFDVSTAGERLLRTGKLGLAGMNERANLLGATMHLASDPSGTSVRIALPLPIPTH